nr:MAG TPA: hypothetical protein [Caudoviricetes sp.]
MRPDLLTRIIIKPIFAWLFIMPAMLLSRRLQVQ